GVAQYFTGLTPNTVYTFTARARNQLGSETGDSPSVSTCTLAAAPSAAAQPFSTVEVSSAVVQWGADGNPAGTQYAVLASTAADFNAGASSSAAGWGSATNASLSGLSPDVTWYFEVKARNLYGAETDYVFAGATATLAVAPSSAPGTAFVSVGTGSMSVAWLPGPYGPGQAYSVALSTGPGYPNADSGNAVLSTAPVGPMATLGGLIPNTTYAAFVAALNLDGVPGPYLALGSTATLSVPPASAPSTFSAVGSSSAVVLWSSGTDAGGFNGPGTTYVAVLSTMTPYVPGDSGVSVATQPYGPPSASLTGLLDDSTYYLSVAAVNFSGQETAFVPLGSTLTLAAVPAAPTLTVLSTGGVSAAAAAFTNLGVGLSAFSFYIDGSSGPWQTSASTQAVGLAANSQHSFAVKARNSAGTETAPSPSTSAYTFALPPAGLAAAAVWTSSCSLAWSANGNPGGTTFELLDSTDGVSFVSYSTYTVASASPAALIPATTYTFEVRARNGDGAATAFSNLVATVTLADVPGSPAASTFTFVGQSSIAVAWGLGADPAGTQFEAQGSTASDFTGGADVGSGWLTALTTTFAGLNVDTSYYWRVSARNAAGVPSAPLLLGPQATLPYPPGAGAPAISAVWVASASVQWTPNGNGGGTRYQVEYSSGAAFGGTPTATDWIAGLSTTVYGLTQDATAWFRVRAVGQAGAFSAYVTLGSTQTLAADPTSPALGAVGPASLAASWGGNGNRAVDDLSGWAAQAPLPAARERAAAADVGGRVYVTGGIVSGAASAEVWSAAVAPDGSVGAWRRETDLPAPRESHALAVWAGRLYVVGGFNGVVQSSVLWTAVRPDGTLGGWAAAAPLPAPRYRLAAVAAGGWLYAFGGDNGVLAQAGVYAAPIADDGTLGSWSAGTSLPSARSGLAAVAVGTTVYAAGGAGAGVLTDVLSAALSGPSVGPWTARTPLPAGVFRQALVGSPDRLVSLGGYDGSAAVSAVEAATLAADGSVGPWRAMTSLPAAVFGQAAALAGEGVVSLGGSDGAAASAAVYKATMTGTQYSLQAAQDAGFTVGVASTGWRAATAGEAVGLTPDTTYYVRLQVRAQSGAVGSFLSLGSTMTVAAVPAPAASSFTAVQAGSMTVQWLSGGNPAGTPYEVSVASSSDYSGALLASGWTTAFSTTVYGLSPNATYFARVQARDGTGTASPALLFGSTMTLAAVPQAVTFQSVQPTAFTVAWSTAGNPAGTLYRAEASASATFSVLSASGVTTSSAAAFSGLVGATTYYVRVLALNALGTPSAYSASTSAYTAADTVAPGAVGDLRLYPTGTPGQLLAAWTSVGSDGTAGTLAAGSRLYLQWTTGSPGLVAWSTASAQVSQATGPVSAGDSAGLVFTGFSAGS
ncbi:MAG: fibronectin type III domain-containing protein, partial [Elusimicrobia bacterium]|nr:fibronectin type III domain-containing protein [Elusimicrobiota bacterium]